MVDYLIGFSNIESAFYTWNKFYLNIIYNFYTIVDSIADVFLKTFVFNFILLLSCFGLISIPWQCWPQK